MEGGIGEIVYPQEAELDAIFNSLSTGFQSLEGVSNTNKQQDQLKKLTGLMQEAKSYVSTPYPKQLTHFPLPTAIDPQPFRLSPTPSPSIAALLETLKEKQSWTTCLSMN
jgi:hypothetical protein